MDVDTNRQKTNKEQRDLHGIVSETDISYDCMAALGLVGKMSLPCFLDSHVRGGDGRLVLKRESCDQSCTGSNIGSTREVNR